MRGVVGFLVLAALAGCATPPAQPFAASCPAWNEGLSHEVKNQFFGNGSTPQVRTETLASGLMRDEGRPLERVLLDFTRRDDGTARQGVAVRDARVQASFRRDDDGQILIAYEKAKGPRGEANPGNATWTFAADTTNLVLMLDLTAPGQAPGPPTAVVVEWRYTPNSDGDPRTPSSAFVSYTAGYLYRVC